MERENGNLGELAQLIRKRNEIDNKISNIINRPSEKGHIFEYIASKLFPIKLNDYLWHNILYPLFYQSDRHP